MSLEAQLHAEIAEGENMAWAEVSKHIPKLDTLPADVQRVIYTAFMSGFDSGVAWVQRIARDILINAEGNP